MSLRYPEPLRCPMRSSILSASGQTKTLNRGTNARATLGACGPPRSVHSGCQQAGLGGNDLMLPAAQSRPV